MMKNNNQYVLRFHDFFVGRIYTLKSKVKELKVRLPLEEYKQKEETKLLARLFNAIYQIIPDNPFHNDYYLRGPLAKFRRFKRGLKRHRLMFCCAKQPPVIAYLYISDENHLRKDGDKNDPYVEFLNLMAQQAFSHDPENLDMQKKIQQQL